MLATPGLPGPRSALARFIQPDSLGYTDAPSMYQFALNSPATYGDPMGLEGARIELFNKTFTLPWGSEPSELGRDPDEASEPEFRFREFLGTFMEQPV